MWRGRHGDAAGSRETSRALRGVALAAALAIAAAFLSPAGRELLAGDETRYAKVVAEMAIAGSWLLPTLGGEPYSHKPPLWFWVAAALARLFGIGSTWTYLLPSLLPFVGLLAVTAWLGSSLAPGGGRVAALLLATSWFAWGTAQIARMDMLFSCLLGLALGALWKAAESGEPRWSWLTAAATAGAALTKGPVALVILLALVLLQRWRRPTLPPRPLVALVLGAAPLLVWAIAAASAGGPTFARELFVTQNLSRAVEAHSWSHAEPAHFYLLRLPLLLAPWTLLVAAAAIDTVRRRRELAGSPAGRLQRFALDWLLAILLVFSLLRGKLLIYLLPALPAAALLTTGWLLAPPPRGTPRRLIAASLLLAALVGGATLVAAPLLHEQAPDEPAFALEVLRGWGLAVSAVATAALLAPLAVGRPRRRRAPGRVRLPPWLPLQALALLAPLPLAVALALPPLARQRSAAPLVEAILATGVCGRQVALLDVPAPWSREMPACLHRVRHLGAFGQPPDDVVVVVAARAHRANLIGFTPVGQVRVGGSTYAVLRREAPPPPAS